MTGINYRKLIKKRLRLWQGRLHQVVVKYFFSYDPAQLLPALRRLGIRSGDAIMLHSAFELHHGFRGTAGQALDVFVEAVGKQGHLLMPSMAYHGALLDYLTQLKSFDARRTPSTMGLVSEFFRRRPGVLRSVNPAHPILVKGPKAAWFVEGHQDCPHSCGAGSPFEKLLQVGGKVAFFNVPFAYFTFFHHLEDRVASHLNFPLYHQPPFQVPVVDREGRASTTTSFAFSRETLRRRRFPILEAEMRRKGLIKSVRIGATYVLLVELSGVVAAVDDMTRDGRYFYDMDTSGAST